MQIFRHSMATCSINRSTKSQLIIGIFDRFIFFKRMTFTFTKWQYLLKVYLKLLEKIDNTRYVLPHHFGWCRFKNGLNFPPTMLQIHTSKTQKMMKWWLKQAFRHLAVLLLLFFFVCILKTWIILSFIAHELFSSTYGNHIYIYNS